MLKTLRAVLSTVLVRQTPPVKTVKVEDLPDTVLIERYINAGKEIGVDLYDIMMAGEPVDFKDRFDKWAELEKEYAKRGYKTIGTFMFTSVAIPDEKTNSLFAERCVGKKREAQEEPILHAEIYREHFLGRDPLDYGGQPYTEKIIYLGKNAGVSKGSDLIID